MFIGREKELLLLNKLKSKSTASLITITGRRRIGKSRLLEEFAKSFKKSYFFCGLAPSLGITHIEQKEEFARVLSQYFNWPEFKETNWAKLFSLLAKQTTKGQILIVFDEISWIAHGDKLFLPQLKNAWDKEFKQNQQLILAVCGSVSSWIEDNILSSTGFVGRISETLKIKELPMSVATKFWESNKNQITAFEKIKILNVTGGIPRYLEEVLIQDTAEQNINRLCFRESGFLFNEFLRLFSDLFSKQQDDYRTILEILANGNVMQTEIAKKLKVETGGTLSKRIKDLESLGFIERYFSWNIASSMSGKQSIYRISDNYTRFYLKYVRPNIARIKNSAFPDRGLDFLPAWTSIMGLQFENLINNNRSKIFELLGIDPRDIIYTDPYFQTKNSKQAACQIDLLIQQRFKSIYVCEIKFQSQEVGLSVTKELDKKIAALNVSKQYSVRPVLISGGPISTNLRECRYFARIIEAEELLG